MAQVMVLMLLFALFVASLVTLCCQRWLAEALIEALNNFRGGPPDGMHPSPANDGYLLRWRSRKTAPLR